jgi:hypothetical protein
LFVSSDTAPVLASALPFKLAPVARVTEARAMIVPAITDPTPMVAELPRFQKTLAADAPPVNSIVPATVSAVPIWNIQTSVGLPLSVSTPVNPCAAAAL